jgi:hypothetical protein
LGVGRPPLLPELLGARFGSACLCEHAGRGIEFGVGLVGLQLEIDLVERRQRLPGVDHCADLDEAFRYLPRDPEAQLAFGPGADGPDESAIASLGLIMDAGDQDRPYRRGMLRCDLVAACERKRERSNSG